MLKFDSKTFNPEVLYVFDAHSIGPEAGKNHAHDFFELSIILDGTTDYVIENQVYHLEKQSILLLNPGVHHYEYTTAPSKNTQIHIGLRNFHFERFPKDVLPLESTIIHLQQYETDFFAVCNEMVRERYEARPGYELLLKAMVLKLLVYLLRDEAAVPLQNSQLLLSTEDQEKQQLVAEAKFYIETRYMEDVSLNQMAQDLYTSPATLSRLFKDQLGDTPINYLIRFRLDKAKQMIENDRNISMKEVSQLIGYEDPFYFSKLFKKYFGLSPSLFAKQV
ncbi:helix-turn-helix domain-containing protein [Pisciglobus halotolerans]|uniref:AraC-type DNA-binding protein n=1 Tax=Pisciglobus halotolerans TaxID=745365 RepID=A0A1I3ANY7_9LACT|nr:AraC family transcriptional regulator [Pisciglobus halotolerans]SFH51051.1 AraC-type DNA-binding protein [Pisciglobus halotolerans]